MYLVHNIMLSWPQQESHAITGVLLRAMIWRQSPLTTQRSLKNHRGLLPHRHEPQSRLNLATKSQGSISPRGRLRATYVLAWNFPQNMPGCGLKWIILPSRGAWRTCPHHLTPRTVNFLRVSRVD